MTNKYLFIDRDGTLIEEPQDYQVDSIDKMTFLPGVFSALERLQQAGYQLIMVTNQDGLGTDNFPEEDFHSAHDLMMRVFQSQGIEFQDVLICPHLEKENCQCRKPKLGLVMKYLVDQSIDKEHSYMIGDRETDQLFAKNLEINGITIGQGRLKTWGDIAHNILDKPRKAYIHRETKETDIKVGLNLDRAERLTIDTGSGFFDHMLEQIAKHAGMSLMLKVTGDWHVDDHHTIEDVAISLGQAIRKALDDKRGIERFGFITPMDEATATISLDLSGRAYCQFDCEFKREKINNLATEMASHFFKSFADGLQATLQMKIEGDNEHHKMEVAFKGLGRVLGQAIKRDGDDIPSTKGAL